MPMRVETVNMVVPADLLARVDAAARAEFESRESFILLVLNRSLPKRPRTLHRNGGKAPSRKLLRPLKVSSKRAAVVRWFSDAEDKTVSAAVQHFGWSREAIFAHWTAIYREHGIGYRFDASSDTITALFPLNDLNVRIVEACHG